jgi:hypothetical protein
MVPQSIESIKEIQIVTHLWDADNGRNIGSQVNAVSKSGGNQIHGSIYDFFNHDSLNARNFFDYTSNGVPSFPVTATKIDRFLNGSPVNPRPIPVAIVSDPSAPVSQLVQANPSGGKDQFQRNQGGGVIGFPIVRDQTFFFGSFERQDIKARQETHFSVPSIAQRGYLNYGAGGFRRRDSSGLLQSFTPTFTAGDAIFSLFPFPNNPVGPYGENTFTQVLPADGHANMFSLKLDHAFKLYIPDVVTNEFSARYNSTDDQRQVPSVGGAIFSGVEPKVRTHNLSLSLTSQISPRFANQFRASYGRTRLHFNEIRDPYLLPSAVLPNEPFLLNARTLVNLSSPSADPSIVLYQFNPNVTVEDALGPIGQVTISPFSPVGLDVYLFPQARANNTIQLADTLTYSRGEHTLKFGFDVRRTQLNSFLHRNFRPQLFFGGTPDLTGNFSDSTPILNISKGGPTPSFFSASDLAALGIPTGISQSLAIGNANSTIGLRSWQLNFFINENFRVRPGLTFDMGLRYELNTTPQDVNRRIENTFTMNQIMQSDSSLSSPFSDNAPLIAAPFSNDLLLFEPAMLANSYNATIGALNDFLAGRTKIFRNDTNNFGGHVGFAWDPFASNMAAAGKTVIRGGVGIYYDLTLGNVVSQSRNVFPNFVPFNVDVNTFSYANGNLFNPSQSGPFRLFNPAYVSYNLVSQGQITNLPLIRDGELNTINIPEEALPAVLGLIFNPASVGLPASGGGLAFTLPDNNLRSPMSFQYNLQIERALMDNFLVNFAYVGSRGLDLTRYRTPNGGPHSITLPIDPLGLMPNPIFAVALPPAGGDLNFASRPNPFLGAYTIFDSSAGSTYHAFQATATKRFSKGYQLSAAYNWSHAIDDVSDVFDLAGAFTLAQDDRNFRFERGSANFDIRHRFTWSTIGNLPLLDRFNQADGASGILLGGWQFALISTYQTGQPFTVNSSFDINMDGNLTDRINTLDGLILLNERQQKLALTTNPVRLLAALGENGMVGRNTFRAAGVAKTDLSMIKNIRIKSGQNLVLRAEAFNLLNRTQFAIPVRVLEAPSFGKSVETIANPRQVQFALKYIF